MFELIKLIEKASPTVHSGFRRWFGTFPDAAAWNVISDYNIGDVNKQNDAFSFVVLPHHDTLENIAAYIAAVAPKQPRLPLMIETARTLNPMLR